MAINKNYIDEHGNYINRQNFTLAEIYTSGYIDGYTSKSTDPDAPDMIEKLTAEMVSIIKDVLPQIVEAAKEYTRPEGEWITVKYAREDLNDPEKSKLDFVKCPFCETIHQGRHHYCSYCGARMITTEGGKI